MIKWNIQQITHNLYLFIKNFKRHIFRNTPHPYLIHYYYLLFIYLLFIYYLFMYYLFIYILFLY